MLENESQWLSQLTKSYSQQETTLLNHRPYILDTFIYSIRAMDIVPE